MIVYCVFFIAFIGQINIIFANRMIDCVAQSIIVFVDALSIFSVSLMGSDTREEHGYTHGEYRAFMMRLRGVTWRRCGGVWSQGGDVVSSCAFMSGLRDCFQCC